MAPDSPSRSPPTRGLHRGFGLLNVVARRALVATAWVGLAILGVAILAGVIRILPWVVTPRVPLRVAMPFGEALLTVGLETTLLAAPALGWAFASASLVERGEARALFAIGVGPLRIVRATLGAAFGVALLAAIASFAWGREAAAPGRLARALITESKQACRDDDSEPRASYVPFVGMTWLCFRGAPPRLVGDLPGGGGTFTARDLSISDDLRSLALIDMRLYFGEKGSVRLHTQEAYVRGLAPWGRGSNLAPPWRALLVSLTGVVLALLAGSIVLRRGVSHRFLSLLVGGAGPIAALVALSRLEQGEHSPWTYLAVPAAGIAALQVAANFTVFSRVRMPSWLRV